MRLWSLAGYFACGRSPGSRPERDQPGKVSLNKRGSFIIPKQLVEVLGIRIDAKFKVKKSQAGLSLKKVLWSVCLKTASSLPLLSAVGSFLLGGKWYAIMYFLWLGV